MGVYPMAGAPAGRGSRALRSLRIALAAVAGALLAAFIVGAAALA
jgi:hypothetical protein